MKKCIGRPKRLASAVDSLEILRSRFNIQPQIVAKPYFVVLY
jgi:hypothetical protein